MLEGYHAVQFSAAAQEKKDGTNCWGLARRVLAEVKKEDTPLRQQPRRERCLVVVWDWKWRIAANGRTANPMPRRAAVVAIAMLFCRSSGSSVI